MRSNGRVVDEFGGEGTAPGLLRGPRGIALSEDAELVFVADTLNHRISIFTLGGRFVKCVGSEAERDGKLTCPQGVGFDERTGRIFVSDRDEHRVCVFDMTSGHFLYAFGRRGNKAGELDRPRDIHVHAATGRVYVADSSNRRIAVFTLQGDWVGEIAGDMLRDVCGVTVDKAGGRLVAVSTAVHFFAQE
jgi:DNA-binding beta-propeller fold protein YncE